ncbi:ATP-binding protein [Escherichia coli]
MKTEFLDGLTRLLASVSANTINKPLPEYSSWDTVVPLTKRDVDNDTSLESPYVITTELGELITVFDLQGVFQIVGADHYANMLDELSKLLRPLCQKYGHEFWFSYEEDPDRAYDELARIVAPQILASKKMGLNVGDLIRERISKNASRCHFEQNLLVLKTGLLALTKETVKDEQSEKLKKTKGLQHPVYGQNINTIYESLRTLHIATTERIIDNFRLCDINGTSGILVRRLEAQEASRRIRIMIERERTAQNWKPLLVTEGMSPRGQVKHVDDILPLKLKWQICTSNPTIPEGTQYISTGKFYHALLYMELAPHDIQQFSELLARMDRSMPFRCTFQLSPKGLDSCKLRSMTASLLGFFGEIKKVKTSLDYLKSRDEHDPVMCMQFTATTWADDLETLKRRVTTLDASLQSWGVPSMSGSSGDTSAYWLASVPGFAKANPATVMTPPLREALEMMPFTQAASPFNDGWLTVCTPDGKIIPLHAYSPLQDTWIRLFSGTPGSGKSLTMNVMNFAFAVAPGYTRVPLGLIIDVGRSSFGLIKLLSDELPEDRRHEVGCYELENSREYGTNIFDTQLGLRYPLPHERTFQQNFMKLLCSTTVITQTEKGQIVTRQLPDGLEGFLSKLIDEAYKLTSEPETALPYEAAVLPEVDKQLAIVREKGIHDDSWWESVSWWEVVDLLFEHGFHNEAALAQRMAVPDITLLNSVAASSIMMNLYPNLKVQSTGETMQEYVQRYLRDVSNLYPMFAGRTRFEISAETRFMSIDLGKVLAAESDKAGLFYMLARHIGTRSFFLEEESFMRQCPDIYKEHHRIRILSNRSEKRIIAADESHNFKDDQFTSEQFVKDALQGRKLGLVVVLASQFLEHHHPIIRAAATDVFVLRGGSSSDEKILREEFKVTPETLIRLQRECRGPGPNGANFLAFFKTSLGNVCHILNNTSSATELWGFNTSQADMIVRDELYKRFGTAVVREYLSRNFPSGSSIRYQETIRQKGLNAEGQTVASYLIEEISEKIREKIENEAA